jgi:regulator of protease activity HflC (stomatin/prohibitin superfamily)
MEAEGKAKARMLEAEASANSIRRIAEAQQDAGRMLGEGNSTASRLAQIAATGEALKNSSTVYFTQAGQTPNLMLQQ